MCISAGRRRTQCEFNQLRRAPGDDSSGCFGRDITGSEAGAPGREHEIARARTSAEPFAQLASMRVSSSGTMVARTASSRHVPARAQPSEQSRRRPQIPSTPRRYAVRLRKHASTYGLGICQRPRGRSPMPTRNTTGSTLYGSAAGRASASRQHTSDRGGRGAAKPRRA